MLPAGMIWSVVILSPTFSRQGSSIVSVRGCATGRGLIFGPRSTSTLSYSSSEAGRSTMLSLMGKASGMATGAVAGTEVGSVIYPVRQLTAAVSGLTRYTPASRVPLRPSKLRLNVRRETPAELGL